MKKLILYVNPKYLTKFSLSPLLFPFYGLGSKKTILFWEPVFANHGYDPKYYEVTNNIEKADLYFIPHNYWLLTKYDPGLLDKFCYEAKEHHKQILVDAYGDNTNKINMPNAIVLRSSVYKDQLAPEDIVIPAYVEDLAREITYRNKPRIPTIGFVGWGDISFTRNPLTAVKVHILNLTAILRGYKREENGIFLRKSALKILENTKTINTNFILRKSYSGHVKTIELDEKTARQEFVQNIIDSDYTLCVRGSGNFSCRFYETLSLGRIPVVLDTDMVFPLENIINYNEFCLVINYKELENIGRKIVDFHKSLSPEKFINMQSKAREAYENYLRIDNFTTYLVDEIYKKL